MKLWLTLFFTLLFLPWEVSTQTTKSLDDYIRFAHDHSPVLKEIYNQQQINFLQKDITIAQFKRPSVGVTGDVLFAPYFLNKDQILSVTNNPEQKAYGYDGGITNGGLYAVLLNASFPLFKDRMVQTTNRQHTIQNEWLQHQIRYQQHQISKAVTDQYIIVYTYQQLLLHLDTIAKSISERKKIIELLVQQALLPQDEYQLLEIELSIRQNEYFQQLGPLYEAFNQLNNLCGIEDTVLYPLQAPVIQSQRLTDAFAILEKYRLDSISIIAAQDIDELKYKPQLDAFANTGINAINPAYALHNVGLSAGLHLSIPLYDGGQRTVTRQQNTYLLQNLNAYKDQDLLEIKNNLSSILRQIKLAQNSLVSFNEQLQKQARLLETIQLKVISGQSSITAYRLSLQDYIATNENILQAQSKLWLLLSQFNYINW